MTNDKEKVENIWEATDETGLSYNDKVFLPLHIHIKELMPESDLEVDVIDNIKEAVHEMIYYWIYPRIQAKDEEMEGIIKAKDEEIERLRGENEKFQEVYYRLITQLTNEIEGTTK